MLPDADPESDGKRAEGGQSGSLGKTGASRLSILEEGSTADTSLSGMSYLVGGAGASAMAGSLDDVEQLPPAALPTWAEEGEGEEGEEVEDSWVGMEIGSSMDAGSGEAGGSQHGLSNGGVRELREAQNRVRELAGDYGAGGVGLLARRESGASTVSDDSGLADGGALPAPSPVAREVSEG